MRSYACHPKTRAAYRAPITGFVNPFFTMPHQASQAGSRANARPAVNILRTENAYKVQLAVPGLSKADVKIELTDDQLIVSSIKTAEAQKPKMLREEFDYTGFKKVFRLHVNADTAAMSATCEAGVLTIVIPDKAPVTTQINIQ